MPPQMNSLSNLKKKRLVSRSPLSGKFIEKHSSDSDEVSLKRPHPSVIARYYVSADQENQRKIDDINKDLPNKPTETRRTQSKIASRKLFRDTDSDPDVDNDIIFSKPNKIKISISNKNSKLFSKIRLTTHGKEIEIADDSGYDKSNESSKLNKPNESLILGVKHDEMPAPLPVKRGRGRPRKYPNPIAPAKKVVDEKKSKTVKALTDDAKKRKLKELEVIKQDELYLEKKDTSNAKAIEQQISCTKIADLESTKCNETTKRKNDNKPAKELIEEKKSRKRNREDSCDRQLKEDIGASYHLDKDKQLTPIKSNHKDGNGASSHLDKDKQPTPIESKNKEDFRASSQLNKDEQLTPINSKHEENNDMPDTSNAKAIQQQMSPRIAADTTHLKFTNKDEIKKRKYNKKPVKEIAAEIKLINRNYEDSFDGRLKEDIEASSHLDMDKQATPIKSKHKENNEGLSHLNKDEQLTPINSTRKEDNEDLSHLDKDKQPTSIKSKHKENNEGLSHLNKDEQLTPIKSTRKEDNEALSHLNKDKQPTSIKSKHKKDNEALSHLNKNEQPTSIKSKKSQKETNSLKPNPCKNSNVLNDDKFLVMQNEPGSYDAVHTSNAIEEQISSTTISDTEPNFKLTKSSHLNKDEQLTPIKSQQSQKKAISTTLNPMFACKTPNVFNNERFLMMRNEQGSFEAVQWAFKCPRNTGAEISVTKQLVMGQTQVGTISMPPGTSKAPSIPKTSSLVFFIRKGECNVTVMNHTETMRCPNFFYIPVGVEYFISNDSNETTVLNYVRQLVNKG